MQARREFQRRLKSLAAQLLGACVAGYFIYHAVQGDRGILAWLRVNQQLEAAHHELAQSAAERTALERRVSLLSNSSLDLDMLEERARIMLNFSHPDDVVIFLPKQYTIPESLSGSAKILRLTDSGLMTNLSYETVVCYPCFLRFRQP